MVTPLPVIESDVLSLLEGYFKDMQAAHNKLDLLVEKYADELGTIRAHNWAQALRLSADEINMMACDECQDFPYSLGLWPIGRGAWACDKHKAIIDARIESEHYRPEPKR